jgi:hypothetical protein
MGKRYKEDLKIMEINNWTQLFRMGLNGRK